MQMEYWRQIESSLHDNSSYQLQLLVNNVSPILPVNGVRDDLMFHSFVHFRKCGSL